MPTQSVSNRQPNSQPNTESASTADSLVLFQNAPLAMALVERSGHIVRSNERFNHLFGYEGHEIEGQPIEILVPKPFRTEHEILRAAYFDYPTTRRMSRRQDLKGVSKKGQLIPVEIGLTTVMVDDEAMAVAWVFDLTERTRQDERFRLVVESSPNGIVLVDPTGKITLCNKQACECFGYEREELIGLSVDALVPEHSTMKHRVYRRSFSEHPAQRPMGHGRDLFGRRKDGSEFPLEIGLTPLEQPEGTYTIATVIDISMRKEVERRLRRTNEDLMEFAHSASHDLKAPLATIRGVVDIALDDLQEGRIKEVDGLLRDVRRKAEQLSGLVEAVLELARADRVEAELSPTRIGELATEIAQERERDCEDAGVLLIREIEPKITILSNLTRLRIIISNLLGNAIKYRDPNKESPFVKLSVREAQDAVYLEVQDNGLGIREKDKPKVFQMFQRFHAQHAEGSGLGLAMVRKQVECLGGKISFESDSGGSTFRVRLPRGYTHDSIDPHR